MVVELFKNNICSNILILITLTSRNLLDRSLILLREYVDLEDCTADPVTVAVVLLLILVHSHFLEEM